MIEFFSSVRVYCVELFQILSGRCAAFAELRTDCAMDYYKIGKDLKNPVNSCGQE